MAHDEREQLWQQHITAWQVSGLSGMAYCKQHTLTYSQFVYWRKKLLAAQKRGFAVDNRDSEVTDSGNR